MFLYRTFVFDIFKISTSFLFTKLLFLILLDNRRCFQFISKDTVSNFVFDKKNIKKRNCFSGRFRRYLLPSRANVVRPHKLLFRQTRRSHAATAKAAAGTRAATSGVKSHESRRGLCNPQATPPLQHQQRRRVAPALPIAESVRLLL